MINIVILIILVIILGLLMGIFQEILDIRDLLLVDVLGDDDGESGLRDGD